MDTTVPQIIMDLYEMQNVYRKINYKGHPESVATHVFLMHQIFTHTYHLLPKDLDLFKMSTMITIHDNAELITKDIFQKTLKEIQEEKYVMKQLYSDNVEIFNIFLEYTEKKTREAKFVKCLDILQATIALYLEGGSRFAQDCRTYEEECRMFPSPLSEDECLYSAMTTCVRKEMREQGYFYK